MKLENKALNNAFRAINRYLVPDDIKITFVINENLDHSKAKLIKSFNHSKFNKEEKAKKANLNKYELKIAESHS